MTSSPNISDPMEDLFARLAQAGVGEPELRQILEAVESGVADALVLQGARGRVTYTRTGAEEPYRVLVEQMKQGALLVDRDGSVVYANERFATIVGTRLNDLIGGAFSSFVSRADEEAWLRQKLGDPAGVDGERVVRLLNTDGADVPALLSFNTLAWENEDPVWCVVVTDLREQLRRQAILDSAELAHLILEQAGESIIVVDELSQIVSASRAADLLAGSPVLGRGFDEVFAFSSSGEAGTGSLIDFAALRKLAERTGRLRGFEVWYDSPGVGRRALLLSLARLNGSRRNNLGTVITLTDITSRVAEERALRAAQSARALTQGLIRGQEAERTRLARELHDGLVQDLAVIAIGAGSLSQQLPPDDASALREIVARIGDLAEEVRRISHGLHPEGLLAAGLGPALKTVGSEFSARSGISVHVESRGVTGLEPEVAIALYRIAQEALRNVERHSGASTVLILLQQTDDEIRLAVEDDGVGFDWHSKAHGSGLGMASMRERVHIAGGRLTVTTSPGRGCRVEVWLPWPRR